MGSEPYTLRGIPSKGVWTLMTRLYPFPEEGPGAQPYIIGKPNMSVSEFSVCTHNRECYINQYNVAKCSSMVEDESYHQGSGPSITYINREYPIIRAVAPVLLLQFLFIGCSNKFYNGIKGIKECYKCSVKSLPIPCIP